VRCASCMSSLAASLMLFIYSVALFGQQFFLPSEAGDCLCLEIQTGFSTGAFFSLHAGVPPSQGLASLRLYAPTAPRAMTVENGSSCLYPFDHATLSTPNLYVVAAQFIVVLKLF